MGVLPLLEKNSNQRACLGNKNLPADYMADYFVMGLVVDQLDAALRVLKEKKFEVRQKGQCFHITIDSAGRIAEIAGLLQKSRIDTAMADIADQVYQG